MNASNNISENTANTTDKKNNINVPAYGNWVYKVSDYFANHKQVESLLCCAFLIIFITAIFAIFLNYYNIYPFGDFSLSSYDMQAQVAPFIEHFYDVFDGKSSLFYSFSIAGGADVFGTLAYCCLSPFTFIFLLFGKGNVYYGTSIVLPLKIITIALSAFIYLRKRFPYLSGIVQMGLALSYAFCGYMFVANTYISWLDLMIYLPWVAYGFFKMINERKKWIFILSLCLMEYTCFSITSFSCFLTFPIAILFCFLVLKGEKRKQSVFDICLSYLSVVMFSLPVLLPALKAFLVSGRKGGLFENLMAKYSVDALYKKITYIATDSIALFFTFLYFGKHGVNRPIARFLLVAGVIIMIPVVCDEACNLLNLGSYMSYSLRFGFLNGFYFFFVSALCLSEIYCKKEKEYYHNKIAFQNQNISNYKNTVTAYQNVEVNSFKTGKRGIFEGSFFKEGISGIVMSLLVITAFIGFVLLSDAFNNNVFGKWFASRFAHSLGGLEGISIVLGMVAIIALVGVLLVKFKCLSAFGLSVMLLILTCGQTTLYAEQLTRGNRNSVDNFKQIGTITEYAEKIEGNNNARIKMNGDYITACMPFTLHTNSFSVFSSVIDNRNFTAPNFFNYGGNGKNSMKSYNGKFFSDCLFGNKYVINNGTIYKEHLKEIELPEIDENGNEVKGKSGPYKLYENIYAFPHAFVVENGKTTLKEGTMKGDYDSILKILGGNEMGIHEIGEKDIVISEAERYEDGKLINKDVIRIRLNLTYEGNYYFVSQFKNPENILYCRSSYIEKDAKPLSKNTSMSLGHGSSGSYSIYLKSKTGEPLTIEQVKNACGGFFVRDRDVEKLAKNFQSQKVEFKTAPSLLSVKLNSEKGGYLFLNYVALKGHKCFVNGKQVDFVDNPLNFMLLPLEEGENEVEIKYSSPYVKYMLVGIAVAILYGLAFYLLFVRRKKLARVLSTPIFVCAIVLTLALLGFFIVMPTGVCIVKNLIWAVKGVFKL